MSAQENKENMRRVLEEAFGQGKVEIIDEVLDPDFVCFDPNSESGEIRGADTIKGEIEYFHNAVPDLTYTVEDQVAEDDKVVSRYTVSGTHQGEFFGIAGTGNRIEMTGINIDRFDENGKLVEEWPEYDLLGAMKQLGAMADSETLKAKNVDSADETRTFDNGKIDIVSIDEVTAGRFTLEPGWRWSENIKPIVGTDSCQILHTGYVISGRMHLVHEDGSEQDIGPGDVYIIRPGHDAWIVGEETYVGVDFSSETEHYAKKE